MHRESCKRIMGTRLIIDANSDTSAHYLRSYSFYHKKKEKHASSVDFVKGESSGVDAVIVALTKVTVYVELRNDARSNNVRSKCFFQECLTVHHYQMSMSPQCNRNWCIVHVNRVHETYTWDIHLLIILLCQTPIFF